jgi:hypothetical protein
MVIPFWLRPAPTGALPGLGALSSAGDWRASAARPRAWSPGCCRHWLRAGQNVAAWSTPRYTRTLRRATKDLQKVLSPRTRVATFRRDRAHTTDARVRTAPLSQQAVNRPIQEIDACYLRHGTLLLEAWHQTPCSGVKTSMYRFCSDACRPQSKFPPSEYRRCKGLVTAIERATTRNDCNKIQSLCRIQCRTIDVDHSILACARR